MAEQSGDVLAAMLERHDDMPKGPAPVGISVEVWTSGEGVEVPPEQVPARVVDVVRINDGWHVVVVLDD